MGGAPTRQATNRAGHGGSRSAHVVSTTGLIGKHVACRRRRNVYHLNTNIRMLSG
jgi:hypothetical protein